MDLRLHSRHAYLSQRLHHLRPTENPAQLRQTVQKQLAMKPREDNVCCRERCQISLRRTTSTCSVYLKIRPLHNQYRIDILQTADDGRRPGHCMARRPSTMSVASLASPKAQLESLRSPGVASVLSPSANKVPRTISQPDSLSSSKSKDGITGIQPDELFAKYTIAEVKTRQAQLRYGVVIHTGFVDQICD